MTITSAPSHGKQFTLYTHFSGPNPWKVAVILEELGLSYEDVFVDFTESKVSPFVDLCPNGRMPALIDHHNNDFCIWESGAIVLYLINKYDTDKKLSFEGFEETAETWQWLMFQMSGQGPYFGQAVWFTRWQPGPKIETAINRYQEEILRILSVLEKELTDKNKEWLVGGRVSFADLAFMPWHWVIDSGDLLQVNGWREKYPRVAEWDRKLNERPAVTKVRLARQEAIDAHK